MVCDGLETLTSYGIEDILSFPNSCDFYFWPKMFLALWAIIAFTLYNDEKERIVKADLLSCLGVSSLAVIFLSTITTLFELIPLRAYIQMTIFLMVFIIIWLAKD